MIRTEIPSGMATDHPTRTPATPDGTPDDDLVVGWPGPNVLFGRAGDDTLIGGVADDRLYGGTGDDELQGRAGDDLLVGGWGSDILRGGRGNDVLAYTLSRTAAGDVDVYRGGAGTDTLRLDLTAAEWLDPLVQAQLGLWLQQLAQAPRNAAGEVLPGPLGQHTLAWNGARLLVSQVERLLPRVDGVALDPGAPVLRRADTQAAVTEDDAPVLRDDGTIDFYDLDWSESHAVSVARAPGDAGLGGRLVAKVADAATGDGQGRIRWTYEIDNALVQGLAEGEKASEAFVLTVTDTGGRLLQVTVDATVTGRDDPPATPPQVTPLDTRGLVLPQVLAHAYAPTDGGPAVAALADGGHVVVWSVPGPGVASVFEATSRVMVQRFDASGASVDLPVPVDPAAGAVGGWADVAALDGGGFVVVWGADDASVGGRVYSRRFGADGQPAGAVETVARVQLAGDFVQPVVTALDDGGHAVTWRGPMQSGDPVHVMTRRYDADGHPAGDAVQASESTPSITAVYDESIQDTLGLAGGRWVSVWGSFSARSIEARVFEADGSPAGPPVPVTRSFSSNAAYPTLATLGDGFIAVWTSDPNLIHARRFDADGGTIGAEINLRTWAQERQLVPRAQELADGSVVVIWQGEEGDVHGQRLSADGQVLGSEFVVNPSGSPSLWGSDDIGLPAMALRADGALVAVWANATLARLEQVVIDDLAADTSSLPQLRGDHPVGDPTRRADFTTPDVAALLDGGHVVVWDARQGDTFEDPDLQDIRLQRYAADGTALGGVERVNTTTPASQTLPAVTGLADGGWVVVWQSEGPAFSDTSFVFSQRYAADGTRVGGEQQVVADPAGDTLNPSVAPLLQGDAAGGYVVGWVGPAAGLAGDGVVLQRFGADGAAVGAALVANTSTVGHSPRAQHLESVVELADGSLAVTWTRGHAPLQPQQVLARVFGPDGVPLSASELQVNSRATGLFLDDASIARWGDGFIVTWRATRASNDDQAILAQRFDADGSRRGGEWLVSDWAPAVRGAPVATVLPDGSGVIVWHSDVLTGTPDLVGQRVDADGAPLGGPFALLPDGAPQQWLTTAELRPTLAVRADGALVVTWQDGTLDIIRQRIVEDVTTDTVPLADLRDAIDNDEPVSADGALAVGAPQVAALGDGGHLVVWTEDGRERLVDDPVFDIFLQRYDADGDAGSAPQRVSPRAGTNDRDPNVAVLSDGRWVVTWTTDTGIPSDDSNVLQQVFGSDGTPAGGPTMVNVTTARAQLAPGVAALPGGGHVVVWTSEGPPARQADVLMRLFDADGQLLSGEVVVHAGLAGRQFTETGAGVNVAALRDGGFVVGWTSVDPAVPGLATVHAKVFDADGTPGAAGDTRVDAADGRASLDAVTAWNDGFVVTWTMAADALNPSRIMVRAFGGDGQAVGDATVVDGWERGQASTSAVTALDDGGFVVLWASASVAVGRGHDIHGQRFGVDGAPVGGEFVVNDVEAPAFRGVTSQQFPAVALRDDGALVVSWLDAGERRIEQKVITDLDVGGPASGPGADAAADDSPGRLQGAAPVEREHAAGAGAAPGWPETDPAQPWAVDGDPWGAWTPADPLLPL